MKLLEDLICIYLNNIILFSKYLLFMCRCGGIIRGVLTSQLVHDFYLKSLNIDIESETEKPNTVVNNIAKDGKYKTSDIGAKGSEFPHKIYHFVVDTETFKTTHVEFASPFVKQMLGNIALNVYN